MTDTEKATMTDIEKATLYRGLAESARLRFESRRDVEWKVGIAIWSALGVSAGIVASARVWSPDFIDAVLGSLLAVIISGPCLLPLCFCMVAVSLQNWAKGTAAIVLLGESHPQVD